MGEPETGAGLQPEIVIVGVRELAVAVEIVFLAQDDAVRSLAVPLPVTHWRRWLVLPVLPYATECS